MKLHSAVLLLAFASITLAASASETNKFALIQTSNGQNIGQSSYSINKTKTGYKFNSTFNATVTSGDVNNMQPPSGKRGSGGKVGFGGIGPAVNDVQFSSDFKLNPDGSFVSGYSQSGATHSMIGLAVNKTRDAITVALTRGGEPYDSETVHLVSPDFFVIPNYDPGAIQVLVTAVLAHPHPDTGYLLLIPANPDIGQSNSAGVIALDPDDDAKGVLDGKPITLKHYTISFRNAKAEIYTDEAGTLMEAIMGNLGVTYVRDKFVLTPAS